VVVFRHLAPLIVSNVVCQMVLIAAGIRSNLCLFLLLQGHCKALLLSIERLLGVLRVERLALPAAEGAEGIWLNKFGFRRMSEEQVCLIFYHCIFILRSDG
jgi:hypothetical protein